MQTEPTQTMMEKGMSMEGSGTSRNISDYVNYEIYQYISHLNFNFVPSINYYKMDDQKVNNLNAICLDLQTFLTKTSKQLEDRLVSYPWRSYMSILKNSSMKIKIRQAASAVLKLLVYQKTFMTEPQTILNEIIGFYLEEEGVEQKIIKKTVQIVIQQIFSIYMKNDEKISFAVDSICKSLKEDEQKIEKKLNLLNTVVDTIDPDSMNDEILVGELIFFWKDTHASLLPVQRKMLIYGEILKAMKNIVEIIEEVNENDNTPKEYLTHSTDGRKLIEEVILFQSENKSILTNNQALNQIKLKALQIYSRTWVYTLEENLFYPFINSIVNCPKSLFDEQADIMENVIIMIDRSVEEPKYYEPLNRNLQLIILSLFQMLHPTESELSMVETDPAQFVDLITDFCKKQEKQILMMRVGSLISNLCQTIDGYISFIGSLCLSYIATTFSSLPQNQKMKEFDENIKKGWPCSAEEKLGVCLLVIAAISDQLQKRADMYRPLFGILLNINQNFNCIANLPPHLLCKFMNLYSFYPFIDCLNPFLPYQKKKPVYEYQLQACYQTMNFYNKKKDQKYTDYVNYIGKIVIVSDHLNPLMEKVITEDSQIRKYVQVPLLQKLVLWFLQVYNTGNILQINKFGNLIVQLISKYDVQNEVQDEAVVNQYLLPLYRLLSNQNSQEQLIIEMSIEHIRKFPCIAADKQKLNFFLEINFLVIRRNQNVLNSSLESLAFLLEYLPYDFVVKLLQECEKLLPAQQRPEDQWDCFYLLEMCIIKIGKLRQPLPLFTMIPFMVEKLSTTMSSVLKIKIMMVLLAIIFVSHKPDKELINFVRSQELPQVVPAYENKPFCLYLINLLKIEDNTLEYCRSVLRLICVFSLKQKNIKNELRKCENAVYDLDDEDNIDEVAQNSFMKCQNLVHPLCRPEYDLYDFFRTIWEGYKYKKQLKDILKEEQIKEVKDLWNRKTINNASRKVFTVKKLNLN